MVSEKVKDTLHKIGGAIFIISMAMPVIMILFTIFGWNDIFEKYFGTFIAVIIGCGVLGGTVLVFSASLKVTLPKKLAKRIADYATPVLKSKGEVSLRDIATNLRVDVPDVKRCIEGMIREGYFEDAALGNGSLVRTLISCPYCKTEISRGQRKCPNCGAAIKK